MVGQVVVQEDRLYLILLELLIEHEITLGKAVVVVQLIHFFSFSEAVINVLSDVKGVHKTEFRRSSGVKQFLPEGIGVLSVVDYGLAIASTHQPFVVRLEVAHIKSVDGAVQANQVMKLDAQRVPAVNKDEEYLSVLGSS